MRPRLRRDDAGTGLVDVVVATGLLSLLVAATAGLLAGVGQAQVYVATRHYAEVVADDMLTKADAAGCGAATGYGTAPDALLLASHCTYGYRATKSLGDVVLSGSSGAVAGCPDTGYTPAYPGLPGPACYQVPATDLRMSAGLNFAWSWPGGAPPCSTLSQGQAAVAPSAMAATATVAWQGHSAGQWDDETATRVEPVPDLLASAWATGGMGAVAVQVTGATGSTPVGLVVPSWAQATPAPPDPLLMAAPQTGGACALFAFVPAGQGYKVWAGSSSNATPQPFTVEPGQWSVVNVAS